MSVGDYREMVKTLVCGVKTITWGAGSCKLSSAGWFVAFVLKFETVGCCCCCCSYKITSCFRPVQLELKAFSFYYVWVYLLR